MGSFLPDNEVDAMRDVLIARRCKRYILIFFLSSLLSLSIMMVTIFVVDPYQYFRKLPYPHFSLLRLRHQTPGVIRNFPFDSIIVGNSMGANLRPDMFAGYDPPLKVQNLILFGSTVTETVNTVDLSFRTKPLKVVFWSIGNNSIANDYRFSDYPSCMYEHIFSGLPYCYLFNIDMFRESIAILFRMEFLTTDNWSDNIVEWHTYSHRPMSALNYGCEARQFVDVPEKFGTIDLSIDKLFEPLDSMNVDADKYKRILFPVIDAHPQTRFVFYFPPFYIPELWLNRPITFWHRSILRLHQFLKVELLKRANVEIYDFIGDPDLTHDSNLYRDQHHYNSEVARKIANAMTHKRSRVIDIASDRAALRGALKVSAAMAKRFLSLNCPAR